MFVNIATKLNIMGFNMYHNLLSHEDIKILFTSLRCNTNKMGGGAQMTL